jgi:RNA polymerase sigma-70 factor (ECF subfamily)
MRALQHPRSERHLWGMTGVSAVRSDEAIRLVARAVRGDETAFATIVEAHHADMIRVAFVICGDPDVAADAVQQAWQVAWRKLGSLRDADRLRPWLVAVAANETRQLVRRQRRRREVELEPGWHQAYGANPGPDARFIDLARALRRLPAEDRALLAMRYAVGLNATEIADVAGTSPSTIRSRLARLLARLREDLTDV